MAKLLPSSLSSEPALERRVLELFEFRLIAEWAHLAIRELFRVKDLKLTPQKIRKLMKDELSNEGIEKSIALLKSLSLIKKQKNGEYACVETRLAHAK